MNLKLQTTGNKILVIFLQEKMLAITSSLFRGGLCFGPPLAVTHTKNHRQIREDLFFRDYYVSGNNNRQNQSKDLFLALKKNFPLSIFDCGCMPPFKNPRYTTGYN